MITFTFILFSIILLGLILFLMSTYFKDKNLDLSSQEKMNKESPYHQFASILILIFMIGGIIYINSQPDKEEKKTNVKTIEKFSDSSAVAMLNEINKKNSKIEVKKIDSLEYKKLKRTFIIKKEEFSDDRYFYLPSNYPKYRSVNYLGFYFGGNKSNSEDLHLLFQYSADDWLFVESIKFNFDGKFYEYGPLNCETNVNNGIQEWSDNTLHLNDEIVQYFKSAKKVKYRLEGKQFYRDYNMSPEKLKKIQNTIKLFELMN